MLGRQCRQQGIVEQEDRRGRAAVVGQRQQDEVELALVQQIDQARRQVLDQVKLEPGIGATQTRQHARQQEWADSRDRAHSQRAAKRLPPSAGGTRKLLEIRDDLACTLDRVEAKRGQDDVALCAVDQRRLEHVLELLDAGAQGRLGHAAGLGRAAEMAMVGERHQVAQMPYGRQMLHAIAPNRGGRCRVAGASPEVHAAECGGGHKLRVMAVTKRRFLGRRGVDLPCNTLPQDVTASLTGSAGYYWFGSQSASLVEFPLPAYLNWNAGVTLTRKIFNLDLRYYDTNLSKEDCFVFTGRRSQRDAKSKSQLPGPSRSPEAREARDRGFHVGRLASGWGGGSGISIQ